MTIIVRKMAVDDHSVWARMRTRLWSQLSEMEHLIDIANWTSRETFTGYAALIPGRDAVGFAEISIRDYANGCREQPVPFLEGIWVDPQHRRQGVAKALVDAIVEDLSLSGFTELCSDADIDNHASHAAHQGWGFAETERVVYFRKPLQ